MNVFPPNTPPYSPAPVRTPISGSQSETGKSEEKAARFLESRQWQPWFNLLNAVIQNLLSRPVFLNGLFADLPDATVYPENSRYFATDTVAEYVNIYATPGDPTTAAWVAM